MTPPNRTAACTSASPTQAQPFARERRVLVLDNHDSFTFNLVQAVRALGNVQVTVVENDQFAPRAQLADLDPTHVILSPGPGVPRDAGCLMQTIETALDLVVPMLGVCLGHQAIVETFGGRLVRADRIQHGETARVHHSRSGLFETLPTPLEAARYHSWVADAEQIPSCLELTAFTADDGEVMAVRHRDLAVQGVQFHPESILTPFGPTLLRNFLRMPRAAADIAIPTAAAAANPTSSNPTEGAPS